MEWGASLNRPVFGFVIICLGFFLVTPTASRAGAWQVDLPPRVTASPSSPGMALRPLTFSEGWFQIRQGEIYATRKGGVFCLPHPTVKWDGPQGDLDPQTLRWLFVRGLTVEGFGLANSPTEIAGGHGVSTVDYQVGAAITGVREDYCYSLSAAQLLVHQEEAWKAKGAIRVDIHWQVYSRLQQKVIAEIQTAGGAAVDEFTSSTGPTLPPNVINEALNQNVLALLNSADFRSIMAARPGDPSPETRQAPILVASPKQSLSIADSVGSVVSVFAGDGFGSGWIVGDGYIVTDRHVVGDLTSVKIRWSDGLERTAEVLRSDEKRDVALIKADTRGRPPLPLRYDRVQPGDTVFAIGTPLDPRLHSTVTRGVVSALRTIDGFSFIQSDVSVNHGNSGGPLLDEKGRVVGLTASGLEIDGVREGISLFIPARDAMDFLKLTIQTADATLH